MDRRDFARIGFALLGSWLLVRTLMELPLLQLDPQLGWSWTASVVSGLVLGLALVLLARPLARWTTGAREPGDVAPEPPRVRELLSAGLAVLGLSLVAEALPALLTFATRAWAPGAEQVQFELAWTGRPLVREGVRALVGLALFVGARPLARLWSRLQSPELGLPAARGGDSRA